MQPLALASTPILFRLEAPVPGNSGKLVPSTSHSVFQKTIGARKIYLAQSAQEWNKLWAEAGGAG